MMRKLTIGAIAVSLLLSGAMVGLSYGGVGGITEPEVIELRIDVCSRPFFYLLGPTDAPKSFVQGQITLCKSPIFDADGERVGTQNVSCTVSDKTDWLCTAIYNLKAGAFTDLGTIVTTGRYIDGEGDVNAIMGGSGAYQDVGGYAVQGDDLAGQLNHTLHLIP